MFINFLITCKLFIFLLCSFHVYAQVPVREEPRHKPVFINQYFRVLDVWLPPGDTTLFHIHATPSLFLQFTSADLSIQKLGEAWQKQDARAGELWYTAFTPPDTLVHRVSNDGKSVFHVTDVEILSAFHPEIKKAPLPIPVLLENEKTFAYQVDQSTIQQVNFRARGPVLAELVSGAQVYYHDLTKASKTKLDPGKFIYIPPGTTFKMTSEGTDNLQLVIFELK